MTRRAPAVSNVHISNVKVGNVTKGGKQVACFRAIVILGPVVGILDIFGNHCVMANSPGKARSAFPLHRSVEVTAGILSPDPY